MKRKSCFRDQIVLIWRMIYDLAVVVNEEIGYGLLDTFGRIV
jgi:hypothetical protein